MARGRTPEEPQEPQAPGFQPVEYTPANQTDGFVDTFRPVEFTPYVPVAPVTEHPEPATGNHEED